MTMTRDDSPTTATRYRWKAVWASMVGYAMDGFDFLILSFALLAIKLSVADGGLGLTDPQAGSLATLTAVQNFGYYGLMIWLPTFLSQTHGLSIQKSAVWTGVTVLGMMIGIMAFGYLADHFGRKPAFIAFQLGAVISVIVYAQLSTELTLLIGGFFLGLFVNGMMGGYGAVTAGSYPTHSRATAQNVLFNIGRGVGGFAPLIVGSLAAADSFQLAVGLLAISYVIDIVAKVFLIPETREVEIA